MIDDRPSANPNAPDSNPIKKKKNYLIWGLTGAVVIAVASIDLIPRFISARNAARKAESRNNLNRIGLAFHNYLEEYGTFPPLSVENRHRIPAHSWETLLLPYLEQKPFYAQIDFDRNWKEQPEVFQTQVAVFLTPGNSETLTPDGFAASHYAANVHAFRPNVGFHFREINGGKYNIILLGEVAEGIKAWGDSDNTRDPLVAFNSGPDSFGRVTRDGASVMFADGSVAFLNNEIDRKILEKISKPVASPEPAPFKMTPELEKQLEQAIREYNQQQQERSQPAAK